MAILTFTVIFVFIIIALARVVVIHICYLILIFFAYKISLVPYLFKAFVHSFIISVYIYLVLLSSNTEGENIEIDLSCSHFCCYQSIYLFIYLQEMRGHWTLPRSLYFMSESSQWVEPCFLLTHFLASGFFWICTGPVLEFSLALLHLPVMICYLLLVHPRVPCWPVLPPVALYCPLDLASAFMHVHIGSWLQTCLTSICLTPVTYIVPSFFWNLFTLSF